MARSLGKSYFLHHQRKSWETLIAGASSSQAHMTEAQRHASQAEKAFNDLAEWTREADERVKKLEEEQEQLLISEARLRTERDMARKVREAAMRRVQTLQVETKEAKRLQSEAASASAGLTVEVGQLRAKVQALEAEASHNSDERNVLKRQVEGELFYSQMTHIPLVGQVALRLVVVFPVELQTALAELKTNFEAMSIQHDNLPGVVEIVCDQLGAGQPPGT